MGVANMGAASMHQSTWVVLLLLMFGEIAILALGGLVFWLGGEFGDAPRWPRLRSVGRRGGAQWSSAPARRLSVVWPRLRASSPRPPRRAYCAMELAAGM